MKHRKTIILLAAALCGLCASCQKDRLCRCTPDAPTESWRIITIDRSMRCSAITHVAQEQRADTDEGYQTLERIDEIDVKCIDYEK
ncbi:MAG: hypothetical protein IJ789_02165 [Bacteroidales bacterium]|nr:hypothetical protein [Bacteroidales bacterium]